MNTAYQVVVCGSIVPLLPENTNHDDLTRFQTNKKPSLPPSPVDTTPDNSFPRQAAKFSFFAPFVSFVIGIVVGPQLHGDHIATIVLGSIQALIIVVGLVFGIMALAATRRHGREGIFGWAIVGTIINGIIVISWLIFIPWMIKEFERDKAVQRQEMAGLTEQEASSFAKVFPEGRLIYNARLGYSFEIPHDFSDNPKAKADPMFEYSFIRQNPDGSATAITIQNLGERIGKEPLGQEDAKKMMGQLPPGSEVKLVKGRWTGFDIQGFQGRIAMRGGPIAVSAFQVPLAREAIQVNVGGPVKREAESRQIAEMILKSLHGKSNW
jgi:uncharacterized membrane protein